MRKWAHDQVPQDRWPQSSVYITGEGSPPANGPRHLLTLSLRAQLGFEGLVTSGEAGCDLQVAPVISLLVKPTQNLRSLVRDNHTHSAWGCSAEGAPSRSLEVLLGPGGSVSPPGGAWSPREAGLAAGSP